MSHRVCGMRFVEAAIHIHPPHAMAVHHRGRHAREHEDESVRRDPLFSKQRANRFCEIRAFQIPPSNAAVLIHQK